jgi:hypothetical protein
MDILDHPRYKEKPILLFFEKYIEDLIGQLPSEKSDIIQSLNLNKVFSTEATQWQEVIRESLKLSDTLDFAILDRWLQLQEENDPTPAKDFATAFVDEYFAPDSQIDIWTEESFCDAVERIERHYQGEKPVINMDEIYQEFAAIREEMKAKQLEKNEEATA